MLTSESLRKLAALNLSSEQMVGVLELLADGIEKEEKRKSEQKERKRRSRDSHVTVTGQSRDNSPPLVPPLDGFPHPSLIPPYNPPLTSSDDDNARVKIIFSWLETFFNSPIPYHSAPINAWLVWGADFEMDIKPAAERYKKRKQEPPRALSWLDEDIAKSIKQRSKLMPEVEISNGQRNYGQQPNKSDRAKAAILRGLGAPG